MATSTMRRAPSKRVAWPPDTAMAGAFLDALARWVARHYSDSAARVVLPTGIVGAGELGQVLQALERANKEVTR
jgi:hypothetical protein